MARNIIERNKLLNAGWTALSSSVLEKSGYTALVKETCIVMISPIGKRIERTF